MALENKSHSELLQDAATYIQLKQDAGDLSKQTADKLFDALQIPKNKFDVIKYKIKNLFRKQVKLDDIPSLKAKLDPILQEEKIYWDGQDEQGNEIGGTQHLTFESFREGYKQYLGKEKNTYELWAILAGQETPRLDRQAKRKAKPTLDVALDEVWKSAEKSVISMRHNLEQLEQSTK